MGGGGYYYYRNVAAVEEGEAFDLAYRNCPSRDSVKNYWKWVVARWREWAAWQSWQDDASWHRDSSGWGSGGWGERWSFSSSWSRR